MEILGRSSTHSFRSRRLWISAAGIFFLVLLSLSLYHSHFGEPLRFEISHVAGSEDNNDQHRDVLTHDNDRLRLLLPATGGDVDLCKTLLTAKMLGYPTPGLIAWNETYESGTQMAGGSHLAKISGTLDYLNSLPPSARSDIVLMLDAYDIWFQLLPDVMLGRFHSMNLDANQRNAQSGVSAPQKIIFAAGKRCAPNQLHTIACYPVPPSPLPDDLYGNNTDTIMGRNKYTSHRQRYLNSGYIMGSVSDLKLLFEAAATEVKETPDHVEEDNGSGGSDFLYHGSDQSMFNRLFGRQEYMREYRRRQAGGKVEATHIEGTPINDRLNPAFTHEPMPEADLEDTMKWEFGMGLDYFSELGQQTVNAETDAKWILLDATPLDTDFPGRNKFDCPPQVTRQDALSDIEHISPDPFHTLGGKDSRGWANIELYTNLCTGKVPVMVHHNGEKNARGYRWKDMWFQAKSTELLENSEGSKKRLEELEVAWTDKGDRYAWQELCGGYEDMLS